MAKHSQMQPALRVFHLAPILAVSLLSVLSAYAPSAAADRGDNEGQKRTSIQWVNHFDLLPGCPEITTSFNAVSSGIGGGLTGLVMNSSTTGDVCAGGGNKVVHMALELQPDTTIKGVHLCYESSDAGTYIDQIRLAQVQNPPATALVMLDDGTNLVNPGPVCVDSATTSVKSSKGSVLLSLRVNFGGVGNATGKIVVRALGLNVDD